MRQGRWFSLSPTLCFHHTNVTRVTQRAGEFTPTQDASNPPLPLSLSLSLSGFGKPVCVCVCVHYQANPSPLSAECFSKVYSTARQAGQRKDSILLPLLTHGKSAALPRALVSVVLLSRATDRGHKMGLEGTQHRALTFLIATVEATVTGMVKKREAVFTTFAVLSASFFHEANSLRTW